MAKITYITHAGDARTLDVKTGLTVMEGAIKNNIPGIDADCGGACACATCHVYVDEAWMDKVGSPSAMEESMLDFAEGVKSNSRLSCQIKVTDELDGLSVHDAGKPALDVGCGAVQPRKRIFTRSSIAAIRRRVGGPPTAMARLDPMMAPIMKLKLMAMILCVRGEAHDSI